MNPLKYNPTVGEPRIALGGSEPRVRLDLVHGNDVAGATIDHEVTFVTTEVARDQQQRIALAIADRVHGRELEDLRARLVRCYETIRSDEATLAAVVEDCRVARGHVRALRDGMIELLRANHSDTLVGHNVADAFNYASTFLGLPPSNADAIPVEFLDTPVQPFRPTMDRVRDEQYLVKWGAEDHQEAIFTTCGDASSCFGEHYARWKEAVR